MFPFNYLQLLQNRNNQTTDCLNSWALYKTKYYESIKIKRMYQLGKQSMIH